MSKPPETENVHCQFLWFSNKNYLYILSSPQIGSNFILRNWKGLCHLLPKQLHLSGNFCVYILSSKANFSSFSNSQWYRLTIYNVVLWYMYSFKNKISKIVSCIIFMLKLSIFSLLTNLKQVIHWWCTWSSPEHWVLNFNKIQKPYQQSRTGVTYWLQPSILRTNNSASTFG